MLRFLAGLASLALVAACGGAPRSETTSTTSSTPSGSEPAVAPSPCIAMAANMKRIVAADDEEPEDPSMVRFEKRSSEALERVLAERCQADAWAPDVVACATTGDEAAVDECMQKLTPEQGQALEAQIQKELELVMEQLDREEGSAY